MIKINVLRDFIALVDYTARSVKVEDLILADV